MHELSFYIGCQEWQPGKVPASRASDGLGGCTCMQAGRIVCSQSRRISAARRASGRVMAMNRKRMNGCVGTHSRHDRTVPNALLQCAWSVPRRNVLRPMVLHGTL